MGWSVSVAKQEVAMSDTTFSLHGKIRSLETGEVQLEDYGTKMSLFNNLVLCDRPEGLFLRGNPGNREILIQDRRLRR